MKKNIHNQRGSALITVLVICTIITATVLTFLAHMMQQNRLVDHKKYFIKAKYLAESAVHQSMANLQVGWKKDLWKEKIDQTIFLLDTDSVKVKQYIWGGYIFLKAQAHQKYQTYTIETLIGLKPFPVGINHTPVFQYGLVLNPKYERLSVTGNARLYCDVLMGSRTSIKGTSFRGRPYTGQQAIYGEKVKTTTNHLRSIIDREYVKFIYKQLDSELKSFKKIDFSELISDSSLIIRLPQEDGYPIVTVSNKTLNSREWDIIGPGSLIIDELLMISEKISLSNYIKVLCSKQIFIQNSIKCQHTIFYSPEKIKITQMGHFQGQIFSKKGIYIQNSVFSYPSLLMSYSHKSNNHIKILPGSKIFGSVIYLKDREKAIPHNQSKIELSQGAQVNGLLYSDNATSLFGSVKGIVITDHFSFDYSPTTYINWVKDGKIDRQPLNHYFNLPIFFETSPRYFSTISGDSTILLNQRIR